MTEKVIDRKLVKIIEDFYVDVIDDFKEAELVIISDSKFSNMFKRKDYDRNIRKLRACKKKCIAISTNHIKNPEGDKTKDSLIKNFDRTRYAFNVLCDAYIQLQQTLKDKAEGTKKVKYGEYKDIFNRVKQCKNDVNLQLNDLDIDYTDYTYDENESPYDFL